MTEGIPDSQITMLLQNLALCEYPFICAHGRPSICRLLPTMTRRTAQHAICCHQSRMTDKYTLVYY